jgi:hypothetical protein
MRIVFCSIVLGVVGVGCPTSVGVQPVAGEGEGEGDVNTGGEGEGDREILPAGCESAAATFDVYTRLSTSCQGCHGGGTSRPYFASFGGFTAGLVADRAWVVPGSASTSGLLPLLEGTATGAYAQMPLAGAPFSQDPAAEITIAELTTWIDALPAGGVVCNEDRSEVSRLPAEALQGALSVALGIGVDELRVSTFPPHTNIDSPDAVGFVEQYNTRKADRFRNLGGPHWTVGKGRDVTVSKSFQLELTQMALGSCRRAVDENRPNLFALADRTMTSAVESAAIRSNIEALHWRFLSARAEPDDADALFALFVEAETAANPAEGWVTVCAALVRDPLFFLY